jgi:hypothetical protein
MNPATHGDHRRIVAQGGGVIQGFPKDRGGLWVTRRFIDSLDDLLDRGILRFVQGYMKGYVKDSKLARPLASRG